MKKRLMVLLSAMMLLSLSACTSNGGASEAPVMEATAPVATDAAPIAAPQSAETAAPAPTETAMPESAQAPVPEPTSEPTAEAATEPEESGAKALVVYFSQSGNTRAVATEIQSQTGADVFELVPAEPYPDDYNTLLDVAQEEQRSNARPAISGSAPNMDSYDTIYLGFPNWWADMPMILYSFLDDYDLSGKTIAPFCTSGGSRFSGTLSTIQSMEPDATVLEGLHISGSSASNSGDAVTDWLSSLGLGE